MIQKSQRSSSSSIFKFTIEHLFLTDMILKDTSSWNGHVRGVISVNFGVLFGWHGWNAIYFWLIFVINNIKNAFILWSRNAHITQKKYYYWPKILFFFPLNITHIWSSICTIKLLFVLNFIQNKISSVSSLYPVNFNPTVKVNLSSDTVIPSDISSYSEFQWFVLKLKYSQCF